MKHLAFFSILLLALSTFGQGTVRRADTLLQVLTINPTNFATGEKLSYITAGRTSIVDGDALFINYEKTNYLDTNLTTRFGTLANTGRWVVTSLTPLSGPSLTNYFSFLAGTNMQVTVTSNSVTYAMTNLTGAGGSSIYVNGSSVTNINLTNSATVYWAGTDTNYHAYASNYFKWEGIPLQVPNLKDTVYVNFVPSGSDLRAYVVENSLDPTRWEQVPQGEFLIRVSAGVGDLEYGYIGANLNLNPVTGELSATVPTGTNSWQISVNGVLVTEPNLTNSAELLPSASGSNITYSIESQAIATNKINTTFQHLLLNQYRINNLTNWFLSLTNNNTTDAGRVVWYTNALGDYVAYATNLPAGGGSGAGTNAFVNGVLIQPLYITNSATVTWATNGAGHVQATAAAGGSGLGTNVFVNGVLIQPAYFTNSAEVFLSTNGNGHIVLDVNDWEGFWSDLTNTIVASNNIALAYDTSNQKLLISAIVSTNSGTTVTVDSGGALAAANFIDASTTLLFDISGANITGRLPDRDFGAITVHSSGAAMNLDASAVVTTNIADTAVTIGKLGTTGTANSTNFLAGDYSWKQVTTNMIPGLVADILSAATNGPAGGGGSVFVNGATISNPNFTNSSTVLFSVSNGTNITATVTNVAGSTTSNVLQRIGSATFLLNGSYNIVNTNFSGVVTDGTQNSSASNVPLQYTLTLSGVSSTNYVVFGEAYDTTTYAGASMAFSISDKTTSGVKINAEFNGGAVAGTWFRIWIMDTVNVGGSGGDVISTANNNFTQTNNFAGPVNAATLTVNDDAYAAGWDGSTNVPTKNAIYDKIESLSSGSNQWDEWDSWSIRRWEFGGNSSGLGLEPGLTFTAVASGTGGTTAGISVFNGHNGYYIRTATGAATSTGGWVNEGVNTRYLTAQANQLKFEFSANRTNGAVYGLGYSDSTTTTEATDALRLIMTNDIICGVALANSVKAVTASTFQIQQGVGYRGCILQTNDYAHFQVYSNVPGSSAVLVWEDTIGTGIPLGSSRTLGVSFGGFNTHVSVTNGTDFLYINRAIERTAQ